MAGATWTGYSPTLGSNGANVLSTDGALSDGRAPSSFGIGRMFRVKQQRANKGLLAVLIGAVAGTTATANWGRVKAKSVGSDVAQMGGLVELETAYALGASSAGRASTAADVTALKAIVAMLSAIAPGSYPADLSGNGGGGKIGR
jgi:hypothetical protein